MRCCARTRRLPRSTEFACATWRNDRVGLQSRMHSFNGAESSVLSPRISLMILSSSSRSRRAKCLFRCVGSEIPSSSTNGLAVVTRRPGIALSVEVGKLVRNDGTGICNDKSSGGVVAS